MALQKTNVSYNFTKGVDTKTDEYQVSGKLSILENGVFQTAGAVRKRNGYTEIGDGSLTKGNAIAGFGKEIVTMDGTNLYSYVSEQDTFNLKGSKVSVEVQKNAVIKNTYAQSYCNSAYHTVGLKFFTWNDSQGTDEFHYAIVDESTGNNIVWNAILVTNAESIASKVVGNYFVFIYRDISSGYLKYVSININTPTVVSAAVTLATNMSYKASAINMSSRIYVAFENNASGIGLFYLDSSLVQSAVTTVAQAADIALSIAADATLSQIWVACTYLSGGTYYTKYFVRSATLTSVLAVTSVYSSTNEVFAVTLAASNGAGRIYWQQEAVYTTPDVVVDYIQSATATNTGTVGPAGDFLRDAGLFSQAWYYDNDFYVTTLHDSRLQGSYFVVNSSASVVAKLTPQNAGEKIAGWLTSVNSLDTTYFNLAIIERDLITSDAGVLKFDVGVAEEILNFSIPMSSQNLANNLHVNGGILTMYDGVNVVEHGFNLYPENIGYSVYPFYGNQPYSGSGGQFQYSMTYDWTDNQGQIHQSAPSIPLSVSTFNVITASGNTTSGSTTVSNVVWSNFSYADGFKVTGAGVPTDTTISCNLGSTTFGLSNAATATATGVTFFFEPQLRLGADITALNKTIEMGVVSSQFYEVATFTSGSTTVVFHDSSRLRVGYYITSVGYITAISGNNVTVSVAPAFNATNAFCKISTNDSFNIVSGNSYITINTLAHIYAYQIGDKLYNDFPNFAVNEFTITNVNYTTGRIDIDTTAITTAPGVSVNKLVPLNFYVQVGNVVEGEGIPSNTTVTEVDVVNSTITVDQFPTATKNITLYIVNLYSIDLQLPTLRITDKIDNPVVLSLYRTKVNETIFYRVTKVISPTYNDVTVDYIAFTDDIPDSSLEGDDLLYTTGGVVENIEIPAVNSLTSYRSRLIGVPSESPFSFWYSKQVIPGTPVQFSDLFVMNIDQKGGPITALIAMDDKLILFKQSLIFYMVGDGPTPTGINNDFTQPTLISSDSGCINRKSVVITPIGTMYKSAKGIYLLDRALEVKYIGSDVEDYNAIDITSAQLVSNFNQVRFTLENGITLMYDYYFQQWSVFKNYDAVDATVVGSSTAAGIYYFMDATGNVQKETEGQYLDNGVYIPLKVQTNWLNMAGLQGYERFYKVLLIGHYKSPHNLNFNAFFDFDETSFQETVIPVETDPGVYQYRIFLSRQKCESIRFSIEDSGLSPLGEGFYLSAIAFEVGIKTGLNKMAAAVSYG
jgi:hypothetical protein